MTRAYWHRGVEMAPWVTGAASVMDCADLRDALRGLGVSVPLGPRVLDVGCGTGRFAQCCTTYRGVDLSPSQVAYAQRCGLDVRVIDGPGDLAAEAADWVVCFSVFTHIAHAERVAYLRSFRAIAPRLVVDVIAGDGAGGVALWTADLPVFLSAVREAGWRVVADYARTSPDGVPHTYMACEAV